jgi:hypothetical protein
MNYRLNYVTGCNYTIEMANKAKQHVELLPKDLYELIGETRLNTGKYRSAICYSFRSMTSEKILNVLHHENYHSANYAPIPFIVTEDNQVMMELDDIIHPKNNNYLMPMAVIVNEQILTGKRARII